MTVTDLSGLHEAIGRVIVPAAQFELALATVAHVAAGGDVDAAANTHALPPSRLKSIIEPEAHARRHEWWAEPALALLSQADEPLAARHRVVHGDWTDVRDVVEGRSFVTFKPDRKTGRWHAQIFDIEGLLDLAEQLEALRDEARHLADRMVDQLHDQEGPG